MTVLTHLIAAIRQAAIYNRHDLTAPRVVLWPDGGRLWARVIPLLRDAMPELLALDRVADGDHQGPATRLRYLLARKEFGNTPVLYLPGIARPAFRGAAGFPAEARHLFALQYQGQFWTQQNGKDWTPAAFLATQDGGLGLDLARDPATRQALSAQLEHVLRTRLADLRGRRLEAADFHALVASDPIRLLLHWMAAPDAARQSGPAGAWTGFTALCKQRFNLDPDRDGVISAAEKLVAGQGEWDQVWQRYREAPKLYGGVRKALDRVQPRDLLDTGNDRIPANNRQQEAQLRQGLLALADLPQSPALDRLARLCADHAPRAASLWAELGEAPLAGAAQHLGAMADAIRAGGPGQDWAALADSYTRQGWRVDAAAWKALAAVRDAPDLHAVAAALRAVYRPWLEDLAERTTRLAASYPNRQPATCPTLAPAPGDVILFVDGLRCDLGLELQQRLMDQGLTAELQTRWAALPTVTATAKPAWRPLAEHLKGDVIAEGFEPRRVSDDRPLKTALFRELLDTTGWAWIEPMATGDPGGAGWTETGAFDRYGHDQGARLAWRIAEELRAVVHRIRELLDGGWRRVIVLTDHGWLLVPGGLPRVDLPKHLTLSRWGRCALARPEAQHSYHQVSWFWGAEHAVVLAPGIAVFRDGLEYAHGGLTLQEALTPLLTVTATAGGETVPVRIAAARWIGLRLRVQLDGPAAGLFLDLRAKPADPGSSLLAADQRLKPVEPDGKGALAVENDDLIGQAAMLVVVRDDQVIGKQPVTIGEN